MRRKRRSFGILGFIIAEVLLYPVFDNLSLDEYTFMWAAILIFSFLLKLFNVEPNPGPLGVGKNAQDAYSHLAMSFFEKHFKSKHKKGVTSADEDKRALIGYMVLIVINCAIMYFSSK